MNAHHFYSYLHATIKFPLINKVLNCCDKELMLETSAFAFSRAKSKLFNIELIKPRKILKIVSSIA